MRKKISRQWSIYSPENSEGFSVSTWKKKHARDGDSGHMIDSPERLWESGLYSTGNVKPMTRLGGSKTGGREATQEAVSLIQGREDNKPVEEEDRRDEEIDLGNI